MEKNVDQMSYNMLHQLLEVCFLFKNYHSLSYPFLSSLYYLNINEYLNLKWIFLCMNYTDQWIHKQNHLYKKSWTVF